MPLWSWLWGKADKKSPAMSDYVASGCSRCGGRTSLIWRRDLRIGHLYECGRCGTRWYLWAEWPFRVELDPAALPLIEEWNAAPVSLGKEMRATLKRIGASPTHPTPRNRETPCAVTTAGGEDFPCAILRQQDHAPIGERGKKWRLATEIAELRPSPFALPLPVRTATFHAPEIQKNHSPSLIVMPDGRFFAAEGPEVFMVHPDYDAASAKMADRDGIPPGEIAEFVPLPKEVAYFVADLSMTRPS